ncbi:hypothetical protein M5G07_07175 [Serratia symbiotica]|nr:hypothetical protein [Serratia symbiotica]
MPCLNYIAAHCEHLVDHPATLDLLNDTLCYVDDALHQEEQNCSRIAQALENLT